ncbi:hypothetical protein PBI_GAIA_180 [Mycobacterium phage Gaia]|uniref:Uncharacterized protein n=1 Tax=Mycobacterium phage Gaia TaxID=1486472 RepID=A0A068F4U8_9CAUD|nr:hypothetical protein VC46_gp056 [Mycobacterium phage Gaia]AID58996.1 hypothetical protein PBI_GAIA_180 [Mycobacterium phage Gaia]
MINEAIATATVTAVNGYYRADYAPHGYGTGASASGYGASKAYALAHLADILAFNLEHNGSLV